MTKAGVWQGAVYWGSDLVQGINAISFGSTRDMIDQTCMGASVVARDRMAGLKDGTFTMSGFFDNDLEGQNAMRDAFMARPQVTTLVDVYVGGLVNSWRMTGYIESMSISGDVGDVVKFSATVKSGTVAPVANP